MVVPTIGEKFSLIAVSFFGIDLSPVEFAFGTMVSISLVGRRIPRIDKRKATVGHPNPARRVEGWTSGKTVVSSGIS